MIDLRGHGESEGEHVTFGQQEKWDVLGAMDWLHTRGLQQIGVLGVSLGSAVTVAAAIEAPWTYKRETTRCSHKRVLRIRGDDSAAWSPDGTRIVFVSARAGKHDIHVMKADGSQQQRLTTDLVENLFPAWSPDGKWIVYSSNRGDTGISLFNSLFIGPRRLYIMSTDGSQQIRFTNPVVGTLPAWQPAASH